MNLVSTVKLSGDPDCWMWSLADDGAESIDHLFFSCLTASHIISRILVWWELPFTRMIDEKIKNTRGVRLRGYEKKREKERMARSKVTKVPIWVKMHNVPLLAYSEDGRISFTQALIEVSSDSDLKKKVIKTIPNEEGTGYIKEIIRVEYEWKPPHYVACKRLGHGPTTCSNRVKKDVQKAPSMAANKPNLMADQEEVFLEVKGHRKKEKAGKDMGDVSNLGAKDQKEGFTSQSSFGKTSIVEDLNLKNSFEALKDSNNIFEAQGSSKQSSMWTDELESDDEVDGVLFPEEQDRVFSDLAQKEKDRYKADIRAMIILLQGLPKDIYALINHYTDAKDIWGLRESNFDKLYAYLKQHEVHATENKMIMERFTQTTNDPLALMSNASVQQYPAQSSVSLQSSHQPSLADRSQNEVGFTPTDDLIERTKLQFKTKELLYRMFVVDTLRIIKEDNSRGTIQEDLLELEMQEENGAVLDEEQLLFLAGEQVTNFDDDVDDPLEQDLALNVDHVFEADQCDAFDSDVDEAPMTQTMLMVNLSSEDPIYDEAGSSYDTDIPYEVQDHDNCLDGVYEHHDEHEMQNNVQQDYVDDFDADYTSDSNIIPYDQEQNIDQQRRIIISDRKRKETSLNAELHSVKMQLRSTIDHNKSMKEEVTTLKKDFKEKNDKFLKEFIDIKALKEKVEDRLFKQDPLVQMVHMLCKPKPFYDEKKKVAIGYKNPLCLTRAKQVQLAHYNGHEIVRTIHVCAAVYD
nr:hypothetical protein [Tanacetum cinerariifolium]